MDPKNNKDAKPPHPIPPSTEPPSGSHGPQTIPTASSSTVSATSAAPPKKPSKPLILNWKQCVQGWTFPPTLDIRVRLPKFIAPLPLPHPAMCIHVVVDAQIPLGVPYIANRGALARRALTADTGRGELMYVNFEHCDARTEEKLGEGQTNISAGFFVCHQRDILIVEGWRHCESTWFSRESRYPVMARRGNTIRDL